MFFFCCKIYNTYPIKIRFRNTTGVYQVNDILANYFEMISKAVCVKIYNKIEKVKVFIQH